MFRMFCFAARASIQCREWLKLPGQKWHFTEIIAWNYLFFCCVFMVKWVSLSKSFLQSKVLCRSLHYRMHSCPFAVADESEQQRSLPSLLCQEQLAKLFLARYKFVKFCCENLLRLFPFSFPRSCAPQSPARVCGWGRSLSLAAEVASSCPKLWMSFPQDLHVSAKLTHRAN